LLQLPNLGPRSARWWIERLRASVLGAPVSQPLVPAEGETGWLWGYAPVSMAYRLVAGAALVGWLGHLSWALGFAIAAYLLWGLAGRPLLALWRFLRGTALDDEQRTRAGRRAAALAVAGLVMFACVPLPQASVVQGIVWLPDSALVRTETEGFIARVAVGDGQTVAAGDPLFTLESPALEAEMASLQSRVEALDVERFGALAREPERASNLDRELEATQAALDRATDRQAHLVVRAGTGGRIVVNHAADLTGRFVKQGELLAHVIGDAPTLVRAAIPQDEAALIRRQPGAVSVSLADDESHAWPALLRPQAEGTVAQLPSASLGDHSGGSIVTDPLDKRGLTPAEGVVMADLQLARRLDDRVGGRVWVRFDHGLAPLALQGARRLQQLVLRQFNPSQ